MASIWKQKAPHRLTQGQRNKKLAADIEYEQKVANLYATLPRSQAIAQKKILYANYLANAKNQGWYEEVSDEQQLAEMEQRIYEGLSVANAKRRELNMPELEIGEKAR